MRGFFRALIFYYGTNESPFIFSRIRIDYGLEGTVAGLIFVRTPINLPVIVTYGGTRQYIANRIKAVFNRRFICFQGTYFLIAGQPPFPLAQNGALQPTGSNLDTANAA